MAFLGPWDSLEKIHKVNFGEFLLEIELLNVTDLKECSILPITGIPNGIFWKITKLKNFWHVATRFKISEDAKVEKLLKSEKSDTNIVIHRV